jgi:archaellum component FlaC
VGKRQFWIRAGVVVGGMFVLMNKEARQKAKQTIEQICHQSIRELETIKENIHHIRQHVEEMAGDIRFMMDKLKEVKENTPYVVEWIEEIKQSLFNRPQK